jgi:hypothetical protein
MVESSPANAYDDPVYAKFKGVLKGAEMVRTYGYSYNFRAKS